MGVPEGRNSGPASPRTAATASAPRWTSRRAARSPSRVITWWLQVWLPRSWPAATSSRPSLVMGLEPRPDSEDGRVGVRRCEDGQHVLRHRDGPRTVEGEGDDTYRRRTPREVPSGMPENSAPGRGAGRRARGAGGFAARRARSVGRRCGGPGWCGGAGRYGRRLPGSVEGAGAHPRTLAAPAATAPRRAVRRVICARRLIGGPLRPRPVGRAAARAAAPLQARRAPSSPVRSRAGGGSA